MCVFAWVSVSMHAWAILSGEWGGWRRQGSQSEGPGLSQLISSRARPQTGQQQPPGQQSSCESAGGENVSLTLQIESFKELIWGCLASPYLIWPQLIRLLLHYVSSGAECGIGSCVCVCARARVLEHAFEGPSVCVLESGYNVKCLDWMSTRPVWGHHRL